MNSHRNTQGPVITAVIIALAIIILAVPVVFALTMHPQSMVDAPQESPEGR